MKYYSKGRDQFTGAVCLEFWTMAMGSQRGCGLNKGVRLRMLKQARLLTRPTLARRDAPSPKQGRRG